MQVPTLQDMTHRHLPNTMSGVTATGGMHISFTWEMVRIENSTDPMLNGTVEKRLFVIKSPKGDRATVSKRPITPKNAAELYPNEWAQFDTYGDVPVYGTPLSDLPGVTQSQIAYLRIFNIRSVEDLIEIGADVASKEMGLEGTKVYKLAVAWDQRRREAGDLPQLADLQAKVELAEKARAERDAAKDERIRQLEAQLTAFQQMQQQPAAVTHANAQASAPAVMAAAMATVAASEDDEHGYPSIDEMPDPFSAGSADGDPLDNLVGDTGDTLTDGV